MNTKRAGAICGNPLNGLRERVCIEVNKVFDGCITRFTDLTYSATLTDFTPDTTPPYTFVSARSSGDSTISSIVTTPIDSRRSRVEMTVTIPITVSYTDANGREGTATSSVTVNRDIVLKLPSDSISPYSVKAVSNLVSTTGTFTDDDTISFRACIVQIVKVVVPVDILVPSYGYAEYPSCVEYEGEVCEGLFNAPIFPTDNN